MNVKPVLLTQFSEEAFPRFTYPAFAKRYPHLLYIGFELQDVDRELIFSIISCGDLVLAATPKGVVVSASFRVWRSVLPVMLAKKETAQFAAAVNSILAKVGLSCR